MCLRTLKSSWTPLLVGLTLGVAQPAAAEPRTQSQSERQAGIEHGLQRFEAGDFSGALSAWLPIVGSLGKKKAWKLLYNVGRAYEALPDVTHAIEYYQAFLALYREREAASRAAADEPARDAEKRLTKLLAENGSVSVHAAPGGELVLVQVGVGEPQPAGFVIYLAPGEHELTLYARSSRAERRVVLVEAGKQVDVYVKSPAKPTPPAPAPPRRQAAEFPMAPVAIGAALTVLSSALPLGLYLRAKARREDASQLATSDPRYPGLRDDYRDAYRWYQLSYAVPAAFGLATGSVVVVHLLSKEREVGVNLGPGRAELHGRF